MTPEELQATAVLAGRAFAGVASRVDGVHKAVADRAFRPIGPAGRPVRVVHDAVTGAVYGGLRLGGTCAGAVVGQLLSRTAPGSAEAGRTPLGNQALAALNGFAGHHLEGGLRPLAIRMSVRSAGRDVPLTSSRLGETFPEAGPKIAVFVHGLAETENSWVVTTP